MFGEYTVNFGRELNSEQLEEILTKAGKDIGWKVKKVNNYGINFNLGSVHEERVLESTYLQFKGKILSKFKIYLYNGSRSKVDLFTPLTGIKPTKKKIKKFLGYVSDYISELPSEV